MKFVCDRCLTKYSIADEKVRGRILKIRCKSCSNIITVKESAPTPISVTVGDSDRTVITGGPIFLRSAAPAGKVKEPGRSMRPPTPPAAVPVTDDIQWFLALEGVQKGPFARKALIEKLAAFPKGSDVHIWNDALDGWKSPADVPAIAHELQARHRQSPPPPPSARLRPVPPPPSHAGAGSARGLPGPHVGAAGASPAHGVALVGLPGGGGAAGGGSAAHAHAHSPHAPAHPHQPPHHTHAHGGSSSGLRLGLASAAPLPGTPAAAEVTLDTPAPIRELVQAHKAHNGDGRHSGAYAGAAPHALASSGESDALQALNLGGSWRQPGAPAGALEGSLSSAAVSAMVGMRQRQRNLKVATTGLAVVVGIIGVVVFLILKRAAPPVAAANPNLGATSAESAIAAKAPEGTPERQGQGRQDQEGRKEGKGATPGTDPSTAAGEGDGPAGAGTKAETVARVSSGKKPMRPAPMRNPAGRGPAGGTTTAPGNFTPEQRAEANRYGDTSTKSLQVRNVSPTIAKVTPAQGDITRVVNANKGGIKVCYQRALLRDNSLTHGKIDVHVSIGISGRVKNVSIDGPAPFRALEPCIKDVLSRWVFPASSEEYGTEFSYLFQGNE